MQIIWARYKSIRWVWESSKKWDGKYVVRCERAWQGSDKMRDQWLLKSTASAHTALTVPEECWKCNEFQSFDPTESDWQHWSLSVRFRSGTTVYTQMSDGENLNWPKLLSNWNWIYCNCMGYLQFTFFTPLAQPFPRIFPQMVIPRKGKIETNWI